MSGNWRFQYDTPPGQVITDHKPGQTIERVLDEIQNRALIDVLGGGSAGAGATEIAVIIDRVDNNRVRVRAFMPPITPQTHGGVGTPDDQTIEEKNDALAVKGRDIAQTYQVFQKKADGTFGFDFVALV